MALFFVLLVPFSQYAKDDDREADEHANPDEDVHLVGVGIEPSRQLVDHDSQREEENDHDRNHEKPIGHDDLQIEKTADKQQHRRDHRGEQAQNPHPTDEYPIPSVVFVGNGVDREVRDENDNRKHDGGYLYLRSVNHIVFLLGPCYACILRWSCRSDILSRFRYLSILSHLFTIRSTV